MQIIVKQSYAHVNKSFPDWDSPQGRIVKNKDHYERLMKENGMISYEKAKEIASGPKRKDYILSKKAKSIIESAKNSKTSKGKVSLSSKTVDAMIKMGAIGKKIPDYMKLPSAYTTGGFNQ